MRIIALFLSVVLCGFAADAELERARDKQDRAALEKIAASYLSGAQASQGDANAQYRAALAESYVAEVAIEVKDKAQAKRAADAGITAAERAVSLQPKNGEYYRVLATLYGQTIPANPMAGLTYGRKAKDAIAKALELSPKSSSVHLAEGVGNYYLPPVFGGGPEIAIKNFNEAIALDPKSAEAYMWLGIANHKLHKFVEAKRALAKAVELNPNRQWAKEQLDKVPNQ